MGTRVILLVLPCSGYMYAVLIPSFVKNNMFAKLRATYYQSERT